MSSFVEQLRLRQEQKSQQQQKREAWLRSLSQLLSKMQTWLHEATEQGIVQIHPKQIDLNEMELGHYKAPALALILCDDEEDYILIHPQQHAYIGAEGRVDIFNRNERYILLKRGHDWFIVEPITEEKKLTQESFQDILLDLWPLGSFDG